MTKTHKTNPLSQLSSTLLGGVSILAVALLAGCGGDPEEPGPSCAGPGLFCQCETVADCPATEQCTSGICLPGAVDVGDTDNEETGPDAGPDSSETGPDADVGLDTSDESDTADTAETSPDVDTDSETGPDADVGEEVGAECGDSVCDASETCTSCEADCGACAPFCGDGVCDAETEVCDICVDCGPCSVDVIETPWIAFSTRGTVGPEAGLEQLYIARADGTDLLKYNGTDSFERSPTWSPDGTRLAFLGINLLTDTKLQIRVLDFVEDTYSSLTHPFISIASPAWMPDGSRLILEARNSGETTNSLYFVSTADGSTERLTTPPTGFSDSGPFPSPSGDYIYFVRGDGTSFDIYRITEEGTEESRVTTGSRIEGSAALDFTGGFLIYSQAPTNPESPGQLRRRNIATRVETNFGIAGDSEPSFFSDGVRIALLRRPDGAPSAEVLTVDASTGAALTRITTNTQPDYAPAVANIESDEIDVSTFFE